VGGAAILAASQLLSWLSSLVAIKLHCQAKESQHGSWLAAKMAAPRF
jgi:hypothetical protein